MDYAQKGSPNIGCFANLGEKKGPEEKKKKIGISRKTVCRVRGGREIGWVS